MSEDTVVVERDPPIATVLIDRPARRNAVDPETAARLAEAFIELDRDETVRAAVLAGRGDTFSAGADLSRVAGDWDAASLRAPTGEPMDTGGPMGPTRLVLGTPVIAAIAGHAVAGGLELALWCDLRVMEADAVLGVFCRRFGVPLIDGGTVRLPRIVGLGRALDLVLTGRSVQADEALAIGLVDRVVPSGEARSAAESLAREIAAFPPRCVAADRASVHASLDLPFGEALGYEFEGGRRVLESGESRIGASEFVAGRGRGGRFDD